MLKVNYSDFCGKTREQMEKEANRRGLRYNKFTETRDLIGMIIAHDAYYEGRNDVMRSMSMPDKRHEQVKVKVDVIADGREKYRLQENDNDNPYFLRLTPAQANFAKWCIDNEINFYYAQFEKTDEAEYVSP